MVKVYLNYNKYNVYLPKNELFKVYTIEDFVGDLVTGKIRVF